MRFQTKSFRCGPAALVNALKCLGELYEENEVAIPCQTTSKRGTSSQHLMLGIKRLGFKGKRISLYSSQSAWHSLRESLRHWPVILCVDRQQHWVTAIGKIGKRIVLFDPGRYKHNKREHGISILTREELSKRWRGERGDYYGIVITSSKSG